MKKYCKNIDITDRQLISNAVYTCLQGKYNRNDTINYMSVVSGLEINQIYYIVRRYDRKAKFMFGSHNILSSVGWMIEAVIDDLQQELLTNTVKFPDIFYKDKIDVSSGKKRHIGIQNIKQQLYDYIAIEGLKPFLRRIGVHQYASIKGRGQMKGARCVRRWMRNTAIRYVGKADIRKCYESIDKELLMAFLDRHVKNDLLLWLIRKLIYSFENGLSIGSYLSQFLCNLYLSQLYHEIYENMYRTRRKRNGINKRVNLVSHALFYMDDLLILGTNSKDLHKAMNLIIKFAKEKMGLVIKSDWVIYKTQLKDKKNDKDFVDMMGFRIYRWHITIRRRVYKRIRRCYMRLLRRIRTHNPIQLCMARRALSYYGIIIHSDSAKCRRKYKVHKVIKICKKVVSDNDSKIYGKTASC